MDHHKPMDMSYNNDKTLGELFHKLKYDIIQVQRHCRCYKWHREPVSTDRALRAGPRAANLYVKCMINSGLVSASSHFKAARLVLYDV